MAAAPVADDDCDAFDDPLLLLVARAIPPTITTARTSAAKPKPAHAGNFDDVVWFADGERVGAGADCGRGCGRTGGAERVVGRERTVGVGGGASGAVTGAAVFFWYWACSMAWPKT